MLGSVIDLIQNLLFFATWWPAKDVLYHFVKLGQLITAINALLLTIVLKPKQSHF